MISVDLRRLESISTRDVETAGIGGAVEIIIDSRAVLQDAARDMLAKYAIAVRFASAGDGQISAGTLSAGDGLAAFCGVFLFAGGDGH